MKKLIYFLLALSLLTGMMIIIQSCQSDKPLLTKEYPNITINLDESRAKQLAKEIRQEVAVTLADDLKLSLWASDSLVHDPIAISMDPQGGIYYTQGNRIENSEFDIRGHRDWMTESVSWESVEDRRDFIRRTFTDDSEQSKKHLKDLNKDGVLNWKDLTVEKEEVWRISDESGDGYADQSKLYIADFHEEISDLANGVEFFNNDVYVAVGPDLWKTTDVDKDGIADDVESLAHGFAVHIGFGAHGMSGVTAGPDGRIWWGIGDIGMNVVDKEGKRWKYPNQGVIVRCEPDGSNFEVFSAGHRNTHEFVFDEYGNLFSEDNDGDHRGERERLVYIVNGNDSGWRINWQFGKYTDPDNNGYKVWMDEKMHVPRWDGQAAYIIPPIANYVNGPTGMVYNPGTALGEKWAKHFFIAEFRGTPANSPIHAFTMKPKGAGFDLGETQEVVKGLLPTGIDFGPEGALYFGDWIDGWGAKSGGRIWKLDTQDEALSAIRKRTKELIQLDFTALDNETLITHMLFQDMRVRLKAQFELASRGEAGYASLKGAANSAADQMQRIHAMWGMGQQARREKSKAADFVTFLSDPDSEIVAQALKLIGDAKYDTAKEQMVSLINSDNPRVSFFATETSGKIKNTAAVEAIIEMLIQNDDKDVYLRHAGAFALSRIGDSEKLKALASHSSRSLRVAAVVALRRMQSPDIKAFLSDADEYVVAEAARGINDDWSIKDALPELADLLSDKRFSAEPLVRRAINANLRVGGENNLQQLMAYATSSSAPTALRAEAIAAAGTWAKPSALDRVDGRYRGEIERDDKQVIESFQANAPQFLNDPESDVVLAGLKSIEKLKVSGVGDQVFGLLKNHEKSDIRAQALRSLEAIAYKDMDAVMDVALSDKSNQVRSVALELIPNSNISDDKAVALFESMIDEGSTKEKQAALSAMGKLSTGAAVSSIMKYFNQVKSNSLPEDVHLDVMESMRSQGDKSLIAAIDDYESGYDANDPLAPYRLALVGGDKGKGNEIFYRNEAAQCVRCHAVFEYGGNAGPGLHGLASRMTPEDILESLIEPSAKIAKGYGVVSLEMKDGESTAGVIVEETDQAITIKIGKDENRIINKSDITEREDIPSSMPGVKKILSKMEIRDLMAFLTSLEAEDS